MLDLLTVIFDFVMLVQHRQKSNIVDNLGGNVMTVLTLEECAKELKVSVDDVVSLIDNHELDAKVIGTKCRIPEWSLFQYLGHSPSLSSELHLINQSLQTITEQTAQPNIIKKSVLEVVNEVLNIKKGLVTSNTFEWNKGLANHILHAFGERYIDELTSNDIQNFYNGVSVKSSGEKISERLMTGVENFLSRILNHALENNYIIKSPMRTSICAPKCNTPDPHDRFMDYNDLCALLSILKDSVVYVTIVKFLVMTGLRIGEALALEWGDVDVENSVIRVRRALVMDYFYVNGARKMRYIIGPTKTPESVRDVPIVSQVIQLLKTWKFHVRSQDKWMTAIKENGNSHLVFPNKFGKLQNIHTFRTNFRGYVERNGGAFLNATFHRLRHSYGSFLLEQGEQLVTVSRLLGHKTIRVTADIYCTVTERLKLQAAEKTKNIWYRLEQG